MRRYLAPAVLHLFIVVGLVLSWNHEFAWMIFLGAYGMASIWWIVLAVRGKPPLAPHLAAVFAPAILPAVLIWLSVRAMRETDAAAIVSRGLAPFIAGVLLLTLIGAMVIGLRMSSSRTDGGAEL